MTRNPIRTCIGCGGRDQDQVEILRLTATVLGESFLSEPTEKVAGGGEGFGPAPFGFDPAQQIG